MNPEQQLKELKQAAVKSVALAVKSGVDTAQAAVGHESYFETEVRNGEVETLSQAASNAVSLTVTKGGKRATVSSCDLSQDGLKAMVEQATALCRYTDSDSFYSLPEPELMAKEVPDLQLYDQKVRELDPAYKIEQARELERIFLSKDPRLGSDSASFGNGFYCYALANSNGFELGDFNTHVSVSVSGIADDEILEGDLNSGRKQSAGWYSQAHHLNALDDLDSIAETATQRVLRKLGARKPKTGNFPVYFEPSMARSLWTHLCQSLSGGNIYRNESYLVGQIGKNIAGANVTVKEDPALLRGIGSRAFDTEGVKCQPLTLVDKGQLTTYLLSTYSANKLNMRSTGHAGGFSNLLIEPGPYSEKDMLKAIGTGVWVTMLLGQGFNVNTGDYSRGAQGIWVENGEPKYPVMEFTLNSNLKKMLQNITHLGADVPRAWAVQTPGLVIGEMSVSGT